MQKEIIIPEVARQIRAEYDAKDTMPSLATLAKKWNVPSQVISHAILQAGGTIRSRGSVKKLN